MKKMILAAFALFLVAVPAAFAKTHVAKHPHASTKHHYGHHPHRKS